MVEEGEAGRHVTAAGEDVSGFRFIAFANGLRLYYQPGLDLILRNDSRRFGLNRIEALQFLVENLPA